MHYEGLARSLATIVMDETSKTIYVSNLDIVCHLPEGWKKVGLATEKTPAVQTAIGLRSGGFMTAQEKLKGIKAIRVSTKAGLLECKLAWEFVFGLCEPVFNAFVQESFR